MAATKHMTIEKRLGLPDKAEERALFGTFDLYDLVERYTPLVDFLLEDYAYPSDNASLIIREMAHMSLLHCMMKFKNKNMHLGESSFSFFFTLLMRDLMNDYIREGTAYRISDTKIAAQK